MTQLNREQALTVMTAFLARCGRLVGHEVTVQALNGRFYTGRLTQMGLQQSPPGVVAYLDGYAPMLIRRVGMADPPLPGAQPGLEALPSNVLPPNAPPHSAPPGKV